MNKHIEWPENTECNHRKGAPGQSANSQKNDNSETGRHKYR